MADEFLELDNKQVKILLQKAYEWRGKINKRSNRLNVFKTTHAIRRFKQYLKLETNNIFIPNKNEVLLTMAWFRRCPAQNDDERLIFTLVVLVYKLHKNKLENIKNK